MAKYLDWTGLQHFWGKIKEYIKITTQNSLTTIHVGSNNVVPVTGITAGVGLNTTSNDTETDGGTIGGTNNSGTLYLTKSGVNAGSYGPSTNATPSYGATFNVPEVTVDKYGRVTSASTRTITIPAGDNTDTKVNVKTRGTTKAYLLGTTTSPTSSNQAVESVAETGVYFDTTAGKLVATNFAGKINDVTVTKQTTGFTIEGGTTSKTLTVNNNYTLGQGNSSLTTSDTGKIPTSAEVASFVDTQITNAQIGAAMFQGVIKSTNTAPDPTALPSTGYKKGWYWIVGEAGTYAGVACEAGDTIFCVKDYASGTASNSDFNVVQTNIETISTSEIDGLSGIPQTNS